jgi:hypothetical protein
MNTQSGMNESPDSSPHVPFPAVIVGAGVLFLGVAPMPYGYYTLLRIVATGVFAWAAFVSHQRHYATLPWVFGLSAILFNPFLRVHLDRSVWMWLNIAAGVLLLSTAQHLVRRR